MYDLIVIGSGPAGYTVALDGVKKGLSVLIFEKADVGGTCLNKGCIPTKSILKCADFYNSLKNSDKFGINIENYNYDWVKILERKSNIVAKLGKSIEFLFKQQKIEVIKSEAKIISENTVVADNTEYQAKNIIIATGSKPRKLFESNTIPVLNSDEILNIEKIPESILIIGSGAIGLEWARIFSDLGVEVSIVEMQKNLLPLADVEVSKRVERIFKQKKIKFFTETSIEKINSDNVVLKNGEILTPQIILQGVGREPISDCFENVDIKLDRGFIKVDENFETSVKNIYAIGDVTGKIQLAHNAIHQAHGLVDYIVSGKKIFFDEKLVPSVIYGEPEIAWVGEKEQDLETGTFEKFTFPVSALGKAHADGDIEGFIKVLAKNNEIIGAHIISKEASSLVTNFVIAMQNKIKTDDLKEITFPHPTYAEGIFEAILNLGEVK